MRRTGYNPHDGPGKRTERAKPGPVPTLGQLRRETCWLWLYCRACGRGVPPALAPFIIGWGAGATRNTKNRAGAITLSGIGAGGAKARPPFRRSRRETGKPPCSLYRRVRLTRTRPRWNKSHGVRSWANSYPQGKELRLVVPGLSPRKKTSQTAPQG